MVWMVGTCRYYSYYFWDKLFNFFHHILGSFEPWTILLSLQKGPFFGLFKYVFLHCPLFSAVQVIYIYYTYIPIRTKVSPQVKPLKCKYTYSICIAVFLHVYSFIFDICYIIRYLTHENVFVFVLSRMALVIGRRAAGGLPQNSALFFR